MYFMFNDMLCATDLLQLYRANSEFNLRPTFQENRGALLSCYISYYVVVEIRHCHRCICLLCLYLSYWWCQRLCVSGLFVRLCRPGQRHSPTVLLSTSSFTLYVLLHSSCCCCAGLLDSAPLLLPGRHALNGALMLGNIGAMVPYMMSHEATLGLSMLGTTTTLSSIMGVTLTAAIGGLHTAFDINQVLLCLCPSDRWGQRHYVFSLYVCVCVFTWLEAFSDQVAVDLYLFNIVDFCTFFCTFLCLQCFDTVGWAAGRASGL